MFRIALTLVLVLIGGAAAERARAAEPGRDACYFFQLAAIDSLGRLIHEHTRQGDGGRRVIQASSAMQLLGTAKCDVEPALEGMNCLIEKILPYEGDYTLPQAQDCLDAVRKAN
ncbi:MAG: hypothetical protein QNJ67_13905 [Kiloniellales bacterium]|nr:hypothetical protein [Kiloniellales bacterium]